MADSSTNLDLLEEGQAGKEITANDLFDALSPASLFGRRATTTAALTWGYYGGVVDIGGTPERIANGTIALSNNATNYLMFDAAGSPTGITKSTVGWTPGLVRLYKIVTVSGAVASYEDWRQLGSSSTPGGSIDAEDVSVADAGGYFTGTDVEAVLQEIGADIVTLTGIVDVDTDVAYTSDTGSTADSDPGNGLFKWNNGTQGSATQLFFDNQTSAAVSLTTFFASLPPDGFIHIAQNDDPTKWQLWKWSAITAGVGYYKFTVALQANGGSIADDKACSVSFKGTVPATYPFDVSAFYPGIPTASAKVIRIPIARAVTFAANFAGSYGKASATATASTAFDIQKNGSTCGTMTYALGASTATFTSSGGTTVSFAAGDVLSVIAPASPDATLADVGFVLAGTR